MGQRGMATPKTTEADWQQIRAAEYINSGKSPILSGGIVTPRADLSYDYTSGVALVKTPAGAIDVNWVAGKTALVAQPAVARDDTIYIGADGQSRVAQGVAAPAGAAIIGRRRLNAGATATTASTEIYNRDWALPYGSTLGWLYQYVENRGHLTAAEKTDHLVVAPRIWVPTDRVADVIVRQAFASKDLPAGDMGFGSMRYTLKVDGVPYESWEAGFDKRWAPSTHTIWRVELTAGEHVVELWRGHAWGANPWHFGGGPNKYAGSFFGILDRELMQ